MDGVFLQIRWGEAPLNLFSCSICLTGKWKQRRADYQLARFGCMEGR